MFKAMMVEKDDKGYRASLRTLEDAQLPDGDVTIAVEYSTLNYKDGLAITGKSPVLRAFPIVPGIDLAGSVVASDDPRFSPGDKVLVNGCGIGERYSGGLTQLTRVKGDWVIPLPDQFSTKQAMAIGTAGLTAMLCVMAIEKHGASPEKGEVVVTGAAGGVGSVAIAVLAKLGYRVVAVSGRPEQESYLRGLGAGEILDRGLFSGPGKPLGKERWAGAIDVVGSHTLANICSTTKVRGVVAACGLAQGMDFPGTVAPFILRAITLVGVESGISPSREERIEAWSRLARDLDTAKLDAINSEVGLSEVIETAPRLLAGQVRGRLVVDVSR